MLVNQRKSYIGTKSRIFEEENFVLEKYVEGGVEELDINRLSDLITLKYNSIYSGIEKLGDVEEIKSAFIGFQKHLYEQNENRI